MLKPSEDRTLAFFESLLLDENGIEELRDTFYGGVRETFTSTHIDKADNNIIYSIDRTEYDESIKIKNDFNDFLRRRLDEEKEIAKALISSKSAIILSSNQSNNTFFSFTENTLLDLKSNSNHSDYSIIHKVIVDLMEFLYSKYNRFHNFSKEYLETLSVYRKEIKKNHITLSFNWKESHKKKEIEFLYNKLMNAKPPFINSSLETFTKAFTDKPLENDEYIKWLCVSVKNKKVISQVTLVALLEELFKSGYIVSDYNDFNKSIENIFAKPNGVKLKGIKVTKKENSKNPSRMGEILDILQELKAIA
ncbi:hypothetical protein [uncultured Gelidibacter sp.]|uniref:hypothetical protein n=1 Tax=uncultured Gelidibacter sp. TaxID=259318 RepID=UPI0026261F32|nr:hypothetical protein [uncultured Gelidibacter sp.]